MSQADEHRGRAGPGKAVVPLGIADRNADDWADFRPAIRWAQQRRPVLLAAIVMIAAQVAWRAEFLSRMYFFRQDFFNLDFAAQSPFDWKYLSYVGTGHVFLGERAIIWLLARMSLYGWGLASAVSLAFLAAAGLAAFAVLRTLFGERPAILIPLALYLLSPLNLAGLGWWTVALETLPLQLALLMAVNSHIHYVRTRRPRQLAAAVVWMGFGMLSFEKGVIVPLLLFAVTSAYLMGGGSWLSGMRRALAGYARAWLAYAALLAAYAVVLVTSLRTSTVQPGAPPSSAAVVTFSKGLLKNVLLPGSIGGPWRWWPVPGGFYALAAPPAGLIWLAFAVAIVVVGASILRSRESWRAWAIFALWVILADLMPVIISKLSWYPVLLALDTHYLADAAVVLALCAGLAFLPVISESAAMLPRRAPAEQLGHQGDGLSQAWRSAAAGLLAVYVVGSIWSASTYRSVTSGHAAASYILNATQATGLAAAGTPVLNSPVPSEIKDSNNDARAVVGPIQAGKLRWIDRPNGTIDSLQVFGLDGRLYPAWVYGTSSGRPSTSHGCWPERGGQILVRFFTHSPSSSTSLRIGYIWGGGAAGYVDVWYGGTVHVLAVRPGLHTAYLPVSGSATDIRVTGLLGQRMCVGDVEAGVIRPALSGSVPGAHL